MYPMNPYASVNPAMAGVTQQRLANYQSQMPQMPTYQPQQFAPQPPMPLMMKGRTVASLDEVKAAQLERYVKGETVNANESVDNDANV